MVKPVTRRLSADHDLDTLIAMATAAEKRNSGFCSMELGLQPAPAAPKAGGFQLDARDFALTAISIYAGWFGAKSAFAAADSSCDKNTDALAWTALSIASGLLPVCIAVTRFIRSARHAEIKEEKDGYARVPRGEAAYWV